MIYVKLKDGVRSKHQFTINDLYDVHGWNKNGFTQRELEEPCRDLGNTSALLMVNRWNQKGDGFLYYIEASELGE